ncbi:hypothetical protein C7U65_20565 [Bradyrhizobium sp. WBAH23]|nr:hypothetical protein [Bradyrhizobium sp. WBAH30]MDD1543714.1 hypothetical protein [Bradyrhizobium sp. WBAH41]MDD1558001.1 hypothetical protein [Bradyrhizobium sp. WBAH23]MDD1565413.1 hypothetical protein [Bradyrhizobium sp. WBAH33]MDD1592765.1 hypothetical protein [Bradyrhizobium sp. WBAH42]NRB88526.1 hypothetical protein [Bradyrhizobium sp. WBAH10]
MCVDVDGGAVLYPPLEGEGRSREARAGWGDLSTRALFVAEGPSPHPVSHFAALNMRRPSGELRSSRTPPGEGKSAAGSLRMMTKQLPGQSVRLKSARSDGEAFSWRDLLLRLLQRHSSSLALPATRSRPAPRARSAAPRAQTR